MSGSRARVEKYLADHRGDFSSMRLNSAIALGMSFVYGALASVDFPGITENRENAEIIFRWYLLAAFGPKVGQKFAEKSFPD